MKKFFTMIGAALLAMNVNAQTTLKVNSFRMGIGEKKTVTINMDNEGFAGASFVCDVYLPEGVEIEKNSSGEYNLSYNAEGGRSVDPQSLFIASGIQNDGAVRIVCFPQDAKAFNGTSGAILNIPLIASESLSKGTEEVTIATQEITDATGLNAVKPDASISYMTAFLRGDVNDDDEINVGDLVSVSNFMAGDETVSKDDADANEDTEVNVGDLVTISNIMAGNK